jgi:hypothetical protein
MTFSFRVEAKEMYQVLNSSKNQTRYVKPPKEDFPKKRKLLQGQTVVESKKADLSKNRKIIQGQSEESQKTQNLCATREKINALIEDIQKLPEPERQQIIGLTMANLSKILLES